MKTSNNPVARNVADLEEELTWFARFVDARLYRAFGGNEDPESAGPPTAPPDQALPSPPDFSASPSAWATFLRTHSLSLAERLTVVLALVPHLRPRLLDVFFTRNALFDRRFTEFGGLSTDDSFTPTGETAAFLLGGDDLTARLTIAQLLAPEHRLMRAGILRSSATDALPLKVPLLVDRGLPQELTVGQRTRAPLGASFPAHRLDTALEWDDLILHPGTHQQVQDILAFIAHGHTLMNDWRLSARLRPGHRALFYGPPGTGKTLTAALLGKRSPRREVYRVDLSLVVSKYIGETEKNLSRVFDYAQHHGWILFFDEADALFGKRTETKDAHDRYANQEVAYLLQRIELFDGIVILASNMRDNLDVAFARRFESMIYFPLPRAEERLRLWQQGMSPRARLADDVDLAAFAHQYDLSGGAIMNVIRQVCLTAIAEGERRIVKNDLTIAIRRELAKEGRRT